MINIQFLRQFRIAGYAVFDMILAFVGMVLLAPILNKLLKKIKIVVPKKNWLFFTFPVSILIHLLVGQQTLMVKNFLNINGNYALKAFIVIFLILGIRGIKKLK